MDLNSPNYEPTSTPANNQRQLRPLLGIAIGTILLATGFYLGNNYRIVWSSSGIPMPSIVSSAESEILQNPLFNQVQELMKTKYLRANELEKQDMLYGAIAGMVNSAGDPYTSFFDPEQNQEAETQLSGQYEGIGAELGFNESKQLTVIAPIKDSPALKAGIRAGDLILEIDGEDTRDITLTEAVNTIRGEAGTTVTLTILHPDAKATEEISITRQQITIESIELTFEDNPQTPAKDTDIAYLRLSRFGDTTESEWDAAVNQIKQQKATALILDLRNNPGGYLQTSIYIGSEFFKDGVIVGQQDATGEIVNFEVERVGRLTDIPVVVLINGGSASASEIVSGALQARDRATIIGVTSFGKGSVQQVIDLPNDTSLHVTIAKWVLPNGDNIDQEGISPDKEVKLTAEDIENDQDPQLKAALEEAGQKAK